MQPSSSISERARTPTGPTTRSEAPRLRTVTGNPFPRKCACGCGGPIPRDPQLRYVVDFSGPKPFKTYLREHSPDFGSAYNRGSRRTPGVVAVNGRAELPGFRPAIELLNEPVPAPEAAPAAERSSGHEEPEPGPSLEAGRPWASGQLAFNAGQFESARSGFADYACVGETTAQLRARVNRVILEDLEAKVLAMRALHEKLRALARPRPCRCLPRGFMCEGQVSEVRSARPSIITSQLVLGVIIPQQKGLAAETEKRTLRQGRRADRTAPTRVSPATRGESVDGRPDRLELGRELRRPCRRGRTLH